MGKENWYMNYYKSGIWSAYMRSITKSHKNCIVELVTLVLINCIVTDVTLDDQLLVLKQCRKFTNQANIYIY